MSKEATTKQKLAAILKTIAEAKHISTMDLSGWDPRTVNGMIARKRQAETELVAATKEYKLLVSANVVKVLVSGPAAERFVAFSKDNGATVVDGAGFYKRLTKAVEATVSWNNRSFGPSQLAALDSAVRLYARKGLMRYMEPKLGPSELGTAVPTEADIVHLARKAVRATNGDALLVADLTHEILEALLADKVSANIIPVLIYGTTAEENENLSKYLLGSRSVEIEATDKSTDEELVEETNTKIRNVFKKQS